MARLSNRTRIEQLAEEFEPRVREAFLAAIEDITSRAELGVIAARLEAGDFSGALDAMHLEPAAFRPLDRALAEAFDAGGAATINDLPRLPDPNGGQFVVRWDGRNLRAEAWLRQHSSTLITRITEDQQTMVRTALSAGMEAGRNPRSVALDLVGRTDRVTGRRQGGLIGLTSSQAKSVQIARDELRSGEKVLMERYLTRKLRDRKFDARVLKAIEGGYSLDAETIQRIGHRYRDRMLLLRGETIARTETMAALGQSNIEAMQQAIDKGAVKSEAVTKTWHTARDGRVRDSHAAQDRQVVGIDGTFSNGLRFPGDPAGNPAETVNCFVPWSRIALTGIRRAISRRYSGEIVELSVGGEVNLSVTPNHPVLTDRGWVAAGHVNEGDYLVHCRLSDQAPALGAEPHVANVYSRADEVYRSAQSLGINERASRGVVNFHGDVPDEDVDIVSVDVSLRVALKPAVAKILDSLSLAETDNAKGAALFNSVCGIGDRRNTLAGNGSLIDRRPGFVGIGDRRDHPFVPVKVTSARRFHYEGPVFNFETDNGLIIADDIISHNCRCWMEIRIDHTAALVEQELAGLGLG